MFNLLMKMTNNRSPDMMKLKTTAVQKSDWYTRSIILQNLHRVKPQEVTVLKLPHKDHKLHSEQTFESANMLAWAKTTGNKEKESMFYTISVAVAVCGWKHAQTHA